MRITPTREQVDYLASIGCSKATTPEPGRLAAKPPEATPVPPASAGSRTVPWWVIFLLLLALLLFLAGRARTEELPLTSEDGVPVAQAEVVPNGDNLTVQELDAITPEKSSLSDPAGHAPLPEPLATVQEQMKGIEQRLSVLQESFHGDLADDRDLTATKLRIIDVRLDDLELQLVDMLNTLGQRIDDIGDLASTNAKRASDSIAEARHADFQVFDVEVADLREDLVVLERGFRRALALFSIVAVLSVGWLAIGGMIVERRMRQVEQSVISRLSETAAGCAAASPCGLSPAQGGSHAGKPTAEKKVDIEPKRQTQEDVPEPARKMEAIIALAHKCDHLRLKPSISSRPWELGLATIKGNVRSENQDYGLCFQIGDHDIMITADGCGGLPRGQRGAYLAVVSAAVSIVKTYGTAPRWYTPSVQHAAAQAIMAAAHRLAVEGDKLNITEVRGGLRTTLIVVVGNNKKLGYSYIGDGGGWILSATGELHRFLDPQKASDAALNVLAASLGPMMEGDPVTGLVDRGAGDIVIVGSDGVFDRVEPSFPKDVLRGCIQHNGDLQKTAEQVVEELASFKDAAGYVCDDNLTLGIMGTGIGPRLCEGFWAPVEAVAAVEADSSSAATAPDLREDP